MKFTLQITQKRNGTFDHQVTDEAGQVIGTRNSRKRYAAATVVRNRLEAELQHAKEILGYYRVGSIKAPAGEIQATIAGYEKRISELESRIAAGEKNQPYCLSFNSRPTLPPGGPAAFCELLGFAVEGGVL